MTTYNDSENRCQFQMLRRYPRTVRQVVKKPEQVNQIHRHTQDRTTATLYQHIYCTRHPKKHKCIFPKNKKWSVTSLLEQ